MHVEHFAVAGHDVIYAGIIVVFNRLKHALPVIIEPCSCPVRIGYISQEIHLFIGKRGYTSDRVLYCFELFIISGTIISKINPRAGICINISEYMVTIFRTIVKAYPVAVIISYFAKIPLTVKLHGWGFFLVDYLVGIIARLSWQCKAQAVLIFHVGAEVVLCAIAVGVRIWIVGYSSSVYTLYYV